jgi:hypothetical protein
MKDSITPYSATFSQRHPDSVCLKITDTNLTTKNVPAVWWQQMSKWHGHSQGNPRSLRQLAAAYPHRSILVVASETYLKAVGKDLVAAIDELDSPELLSIVSAGSNHFPGLEDHLIPCDARLQPLVNGARRSLNTRIAHKIISEARKPPQRTQLVQKYAKLLAKQPDIPRYDRSPMSDEEIRHFIVLQLENEQLSRTPLLRRLRDSGHACEQSRFASLYRKVQEQLNGPT